MGYPKELWSPVHQDLNPSSTILSKLCTSANLQNSVEYPWGLCLDECEKSQLNIPHSNMKILNKHFLFHSLFLVIQSCENVVSVKFSPLKTQCIRKINRWLTGISTTMPIFQSLLTVYFLKCPL